MKRKHLVYWLVAAGFVLGIFCMFWQLMKFVMPKGSDAELPEMVAFPDFSEKTSLAVSGFVVNEEGVPLADASVWVGGGYAVTDGHGRFDVEDARVMPRAGAVAVGKDGYFTGYGALTAAEGERRFVRVKLTRKIPAGDFGAAAGGSVSLPDGTSFAVPAGGVLDAAGDRYDGPVRVALRRIDAAAPGAEGMMPGSSPGIGNRGAVRGFAGQAALLVEMTAADGSGVHANPDTLVDIAIPVGVANPPAEMALWRYDAGSGSWWEQGKAVRVGNVYTAKTPFAALLGLGEAYDAVPFACRFVDAGGKPFAGHSIALFDTESGKAYTFLQTNEDGAVAGSAPRNASLRLELRNDGDGRCVVYAQDFRTKDAPVDLGDIVVGPQTGTARVRGTVTTAGQPVATGVVTYVFSGAYYTAPIADGAYDFTLRLCYDPAALRLWAKDHESGVESAVREATLAEGENVLDPIDLPPPPLRDAEGRVVEIEQVEGIETILPEAGFSPKENGYIVLHPVSSESIKYEITRLWRGMQIPTRLYLNITGEPEPKGPDGDRYKYHEGDYAFTHPTSWFALAWDEERGTPVRVGTFPCHISRFMFWDARLKAGVHVNSSLLEGKETVGKLTITSCKRVYAPNRRKNAKYFYIVDGTLHLANAAHHFSYSSDSTFKYPDSTMYWDLVGEFHFEAWLDKELEGGARLKAN